MSIIIPGKNISNDDNAEYVFEPTNQQINTLNTLCYGRMDTPIKNVQFNFNCDQNLFEGCYIDLQEFAFGKETDTLFQAQLTNIKHITFNKAYNTISQFYNHLQQATKTLTISTTFTFEQGLSFDQNLLQQGICSFCFYAQCIESTSNEWPVDRVNMDTEFEIYYTPTNYVKVMTLYGENLIKMLGMQYIQEDFKKYMSKTGSPTYGTIDPLIRVTYEDGSTSFQNNTINIKDDQKIIQYDFYIYAKAIPQNLNCMSPVWLNNQYYTNVPEQQKTRQGVTYTVPTHKDWNNCFYIGGLKYNPSQWVNRNTNQPINVYFQYQSQFYNFYFYSKELYFLQIYHYLLFDSPELAFANYTDPNGKTYNIISKSINNTNPNQYFTMTTTEPLKRLTLQNLANIKIHLKIYDQTFNLTKAYQQPLLILTMNRQKQEEEELKDLRKTFDGSNTNTFVI